MRKYDQDGDGKCTQDEMRAMALDYVKEKKTRRLATKAAIAMGVLILLVVCMNAGLTAAIVFLSKDVKDVKVINGMLTDASTNRPLQVSSADTTVVDGTLRDKASNKVVATASALQELAIDSRLPDSAWDELKYIDVRNDNGGAVHLFVQAFTRVPSTHALHGSYVTIHATIGTITLDGDLMTFSDSSSTGVFAAAQFPVTSSGRKLAGIIYLIGFFNQIPSFDAWNTTYDTPPLIPSVFYANASLLYACTYGNSNLCDQTDVPARSLTVLADKLWAVSRVDMWADLNAGIGKEVYHDLAGNPGWTLEKHLDLNAKTEHTKQTWHASNESYFCRTTPQPPYMSSWLSPLSATKSRASYKGTVDGETYGALTEELLHHFQIKPVEVEHISLDFYTHLVGQDVVPAFVQLRIGSDVDDQDARFIAYKFDSFLPLQSLPAAGAIFNQAVSPDHFNATHCADTLAYTDQDHDGTKIHPDNKIHSTDPLTRPLSRTALTYVLGDHPTWKASEIVAWEDQLSNNLTAYIMFRQYLEGDIDEDDDSEPAYEDLTYEHVDVAEPEFGSGSLIGRRLSATIEAGSRTCTEENNAYCSNWQYAQSLYSRSVSQCKTLCTSRQTCSGGYYDATEQKCYLYGKPAARAETCTRKAYWGRRLSSNLTDHTKSLQYLDDVDESERIGEADNAAEPEFVSDGALSPRHLSHAAPAPSSPSRTVRVTRLNCPVPCTPCGEPRDYPLKMQNLGSRQGWWDEMFSVGRVYSLDECLSRCQSDSRCTGLRFYNSGFSYQPSGQYRCMHSRASCVLSRTCKVREYSLRDRVALVHYYRSKECNTDSSQSCNPDRTVGTSGFPFNFGNKPKLFPCDVNVGYNGDVACAGDVSCEVRELQLCCYGLVSGSVKGGASWDCAKDFSVCSGTIGITGEINVGVPKCSWCPKWMSVSVTYERTWGTQKCCSGDFGYSKDAIKLQASFIVGIVNLELKGTFYEMATDNDAACKTARINYIDNANRQMVIDGSIKICFIFCFTLVSGNIFMHPGHEERPLKSLKKSGDCCVLVAEKTSLNSCGYCPNGHKFELAWHCGGSRRCK